MEEGLPKSFDVVVIGTGLAESIVSAAASRNGHSVLHLDPREYYGSACATLNFDLWLSKEFVGIPPAAVSHSPTPSQPLSWRNIYRNFEQVWYDDNKEVKEEFDKNKRRFNIDIFPQVTQNKNS
jgi:RAB protein geranylgeranyltransferase component A